MVYVNYPELCKLLCGFILGVIKRGTINESH